MNLQLSAQMRAVNTKTNRLSYLLLGRQNMRYNTPLVYGLGGLKRWLHQLLFEQCRQCELIWSYATHLFSDINRLCLKRRHVLGRGNLECVVLITVTWRGSQA